MIKHHPQLSLLKTYCAGELPAAISVIIAAHIELCPHCQQQVEALTTKVAKEAFTYTHEEDFEQTDLLEVDFASMIDDITLDDGIDEISVAEPLEVTLNQDNYYLPQVLRNLDLSSWASLGKLSRSRVALDDANLHTSLLHIDADGSVPEHTHNGFEITLLLDGSFKDEMGEYTKGDFIWLDGKHTHNPITEHGCLCLTVSSDSLHFTQGLSKLLNPIGKFIY
ncbi:ChrR family anti-sigma-E factor [Pseudoalteromonas piratica]|uniref:Transcriptional regulator n=1 Tax=Pseudoalteromonas piratica TaxID=1348114 RepID=A0A0A7EEC8_9GAMM|nr:ChrR family anti-sigma-E factor [Pseudoalteromonas piratica]AIY64421.1 transcriptional regulator [Pseudoalteromonas piratica]